MKKAAGSHREPTADDSDVIRAPGFLQETASTKR